MQHRNHQNHVSDYGAVAAAGEHPDTDLDGLQRALATAERRAAEAERRAQETERRLLLVEGRYAALAAATGQWVWRTNAAGEVDVEELPAGRSFTGQRAEEIRGLGWAEAIHPADRERALAAWQHALAARTRYEAHQRVRRADGVYRYVLVQGAPVLEADGSVREWVGVSADITEQQELYLQVRESEERYRTIIETANEGIWLIDPNAATIFANERMAALLGYTPVEMRGHTVMEFCLPQDFPHAAQRIASNLAGKFEQFDFRFRHRDGHSVEVLACTSPVRDGSGQMVGALGMFTDLSERKRLERERADVMQIVAHDLGNPLAAAKMQAQLLRRRLEEGKEPDVALVEAIERQVLRMQRLLKDMRDAANLDMDQLALECERLDLVQVCRQEAEAQMAATGHQVRLLLPEEPVEVSADRDRIAQVVANLLANAHAFSPADRPITLRVMRQGSAVCVEVADEGRGIPPEALPRLFERFYRVPGNAGASGAGSGLGLGLYICRQLIERHGGTIDVASVAGHGSTFSFTLPLAPAR